MGRKRLLPAERAVYALRRRGPAGTARVAAVRLRRRVHMHERHVWYELALTEDRPRLDLPDGFVLRLARERDLAGIAELPGTDSVPVMRRHRGMGNELWMLDAGGGQVAFACSIFFGRTPVAAARGGSIELPPWMACMEDCATAPELRGRGLAPAAYSAIADLLEREGASAIVMKIEEPNRPSRRAAQKAGFREVATMTFDRAWNRRAVAVSPMDDDVGPLLSLLIAA